ncbi:MAG: beta-lactamase family protein [Flavobacteriales bacterium]|jgi:CubicO group peptidase (beta-lactamase class C family)|nr:beta-lactamase family protein [Flavobacteriales bacterium]
MKNWLLYIFSLSLGNLLFAQNLQEVLNEYQDSLSHYGIVALVDNGKNIQTAKIGWEFEKSPMSIENRFCIGSVTKMFTATIILKLHEEKRLNIQDSIGKYIQPHKFIDPTIQIKHLLNHTSGIKDIVNASLANKALIEVNEDFSDTYLLSLIDTVDFPKGKQYQYSNSNFFLLRKIIEQITDKPYSSVLQEMIFNPLNLENTLPYHSKNIKNLAHPIIGKQDLHNLPKRNINQVSLGIGNIVSDVFDVNVFLRGLFFQKKILSTDVLKKMLDFQKIGKTEIGLSIFKEKYGQRTVYGHTGRTISYISYAFVDQKTHTSFVLLCNNANDPIIDLLIEKVCRIKW